MEFDLAGHKDGHAERFSPDQHGGRLIEAEHVTRYRWAARAVATCRNVLDAGCGTAYGSRLLAEAGAGHVTGVDIAAPVLEAVAPRMPENVTLTPGDLLALDFADGTFDAVVCFEVIEHFSDPFAVLDELTRVLAPDGVLLVSSPNRGVFPGGNPHHHHEFQPDELRAALGARFAHVHLVQQQDYLLSATLEQDQFLAGDGAVLCGLKVAKFAHDEANRELYTLAVASNAELPKLGQVGVITTSLEYALWLQQLDEQRQALAAKDNRIAELETMLSERDRLAELLLDAEQRLAELPMLAQRVEDLRHDLQATSAAEEALRAHANRLEERLTRDMRTYANVVNSPSWKLTKPLRAAKKLLAR